MPKLFSQIQAAVEQDRYVFSIHADERLRERGIPAWQVISGLPDGRLLLERRDSLPNPAVEIEQILPDGTKIKAVWAWLATSQTAKLITVHFFNR